MFFYKKKFVLFICLLAVFITLLFFMTEIWTEFDSSSDNESNSDHDSESNSDIVYCLKPDSQKYLQEILPLDTKDDFTLDGAIIQKEDIVVHKNSDPPLFITLMHPSRSFSQSHFRKSKNFNIVLDKPVNADAIRIFDQISEYVRNKDIAEKVWDSCKRDGYLKNDENTLVQTVKQNGNTSKAGKEDVDKPFRFNLELLLEIIYGITFVFLLLLGVFWQKSSSLRELLHKKALKNTYAVYEKKSSFFILLAVVFSCCVIFAWGSRVGFTSEMIGPLNFYNYQYIEQQTTTAEVKPADCSDGFFRQHLRPVFGFCDSNGKQYALLYNDYTPTIFYLPLRLIGEWIPSLRGATLRWFLLPLIFLTLWLFTRLLSNKSTIRPAVFTILIMTSFPGIIVYSTLYLFEILVMICAVLLWFALDRFNKTGKTIWFILSICILGLPFLTKLTAILLVVPLYIAYVVAYGLRKVSYRNIVFAFLLMTLLPVSYTFMHHFKDPGFAKFTYTFNKYIGDDEGDDISDKKDADEQNNDFFSKGVIFSNAILCGTLFEANPYCLKMISYFICFFLICIYVLCCCISFVGKEGTPPSKVFIMVLFLIVIPLYFLLYKSNTGSVPLYQILPFWSAVIAFLFIDVHKLIKNTFQNKLAGKIVLAFLITMVCIMSIYRWYESIQDINNNLSSIYSKDQERIIEQLLDKQIYEPIMSSTYYLGVFEFLSNGKIKPKYMNALLKQNMSAEEWELVLETTKDVNVDYLFMDPCDRMVLSCRSNPDAVSRFKEAVLNRKRNIIKQISITDSDNKQVFVVFRLEKEK